MGARVERRRNPAPPLRADISTRRFTPTHTAIGEVGSTGRIAAESLAQPYPPPTSGRVYHAMPKRSSTGKVSAADVRIAKGGTTVAFGEYGLVLWNRPGSQPPDRSRTTRLTRSVSAAAEILIPFPRTSRRPRKPAETRMGSARVPRHWVRGQARPDPLRDGGVDRAEAVEACVSPAQSFRSPPESPQGRPRQMDIEKVRGFSDGELEEQLRQAKQDLGRRARAHDPPVEGLQLDPPNQTNDRADPHRAARAPRRALRTQTA